MTKADWRNALLAAAELVAEQKEMIASCGRFVVLVVALYAADRDRARRERDDIARRLAAASIDAAQMERVASRLADRIVAADKALDRGDICAARAALGVLR